MPIENRFSSHNTTHFLDRSDIESLENLAGITQVTNPYIDVDSHGQVGKAYSEGILASIHRTARWAFGLSHNSGDLKNLTKLLDRVSLASACAQEDYSELLSEAIRGIEHLKAKYKIKGKDTVVSDLDKILTKSKTILNRISQHNHPIHSEQANGNKTDLNAQMIACKLGEIEKFGLTGAPSTAGFTYYIRKIQSFLHTEQLEENQRKQLESYLSALQKGLEIHEVGDFNHPVYKGVSNEQQYHLRDKLVHKMIEEGLNSNPDTGIVLPLRILFENEENETQGHGMAMGIRKNKDGIFLSLYNIGLGSQEEVRVRLSYHNGLHLMLRGEDFPLEAYGQPFTCYGPYTEEDAVRIVNNQRYYHNQIFFSPNTVLERFLSPLDNRRKLPAGVPDRRFQVTGNCFIANLREWLIDTSQRNGSVDLFNRFDQYGQKRTFSCATLEKAEVAKGKKPEDLLHLNLFSQEGQEQEDGWEII